MSAYEQTPNDIPGESGRFRFYETPMPPMDNYKQEKNGTYVCDRLHKKKPCKKVFERKTELKKHLRTHDKPVYCPFYNDPDYPCGNGRAAEQRDMERHMSSHHSEWAKERGIKPGAVWCECGVEFTREDNLKKHKKEFGH
ncbi:hypothetical protein PG995_013885 [Apiospora arundinis]